MRGTCRIPISHESSCTIRITLCVLFKIPSVGFHQRCAVEACPSFAVRDRPVRSAALLGGGNNLTICRGLTLLHCLEVEAPRLYSAERNDLGMSRLRDALSQSQKLSPRNRPAPGFWAVGVTLGSQCCGNDAILLFIGCSSPALNTIAC